MTNLIKITDLGSSQGRIIDLDTANPTLMDGLRNFVLSLNGNGYSAKGTANAMMDMNNILDGALPFTRNGVRFEKYTPPATGDAS